MCPFSSVHRTNCAILTVRSPHFLSNYCDFIEFNVANNETESKRNFPFFETENCFFWNGKSLALSYHWPETGSAWACLRTWQNRLNTIILTDMGVLLELSLARDRLRLGVSPYLAEQTNTIILTDMGVLLELSVVSLSVSLARDSIRLGVSPYLAEQTQHYNRVIPCQINQFFAKFARPGTPLRFRWNLAHLKNVLIPFQDLLIQFFTVSDKLPNSVFYRFRYLKFCFIFFKLYICCQ